MPCTTALLVYPGVAELDFIGPKDVFFASKWLRKSDDRIITVAADLGPLTCMGGTRILPDNTFDDCGPVDILVVPGTADPAPQTENRSLLDWVAATAENCRWVTGVCTGTAILMAAGPAKGKSVTTHPAAIEALRMRKEATVVSGVRYLQDGRLVTSGGVSAGLDMALWLIGQLHGPEHARAVQGLLDYYPEPPYPLAA